MSTSIATAPVQRIQTSTSAWKAGFISQPPYTSVPTTFTTIRLIQTFSTENLKTATALPSPTSSIAKKKNSGFSPADKAGVAVGCVVVSGIVIYFAIVILRFRRKAAKAKVQHMPSSSEDIVVHELDGTPINKVQLEAERRYVESANSMAADLLRKSESGFPKGTRQE
jgi:hypothetical protein